MRAAMSLVGLSLPEEVWIQVFTFLSTQDKHNVRTSCKYFKELVDKYTSLWKDFSVVLSHFSRYDRQFWRILGRRNIRTVVVRGGKHKNLLQLFHSLPSLTALAVESWSEQRLDHLTLFSKLTTLAFHKSQCPLDIYPSLERLALQVTHLSVCNVKLRSPVIEFLCSVAKMRNLTYLLYHHDGTQRIPQRAFHALLNGLPKLKHLSWEMIAYKTLPDNFFRPPLNHKELTENVALPISSLELLNYDTEVSEEALHSLWCLQSLSIFHLYSVPGPRCHLRTWLTVLQKLTSLSVHGGHRLGVYADVVPMSVVSLTLSVDLTLDDLEALGRRLPDLQELHLEPWGTLGHVGLIPQLFPKLKTLKIRHHKVSKTDFLGLHVLDQLERLEIVDAYHCHHGTTHDPQLLDLISQLRSLTNNKVQIITYRPLNDPLACQCLS